MRPVSPNLRCKIDAYPRSSGGAVKGLDSRPRVTKQQDSQPTAEGPEECMRFCRVFAEASANIRFIADGGAVRQAESFGGAGIGL